MKCFAFLLLISVSSFTPTPKPLTDELIPCEGFQYSTTRQMLEVLGKQYLCSTLVAGHISDDFFSHFASSKETKESLSERLLAAGIPVHDHAAIMFFLRKNNLTLFTGVVQAYDMLLWRSSQPYGFEFADPSRDIKMGFNLFGGHDFLKNAAKAIWNARAMPTTPWQLYEDFAKMAANNPELLHSLHYVEHLVPQRRLLAPVDVSDYTFWSLSLHVTGVNNLKHLLKARYNVPAAQIVDNNMGPHCRHFNTCSVLEADLDMHKLGEPLPIPLQAHFWDVYKRDIPFRSADAFFCDFPPSLCELLMPFNRTIIINSIWRYDHRKPTRKTLEQWHNSLLLIAKNPRNIVAADNEYDCMYLQHFTGIVPLRLYTQSLYIRDLYEDLSYDPRSPEFLLGPKRVSMEMAKAATEFQDVGKQMGILGTTLQIRAVAAVYPEHDMHSLTRHPGMIVIPYAPHINFVTELYALGVPLFIPSHTFLADLHIRFGVLTEFFSQSSDFLGRMATAASPHPFHDPNSGDLESLTFWLQYSDYYRWPHVYLFESWEDLFLKLNSVTLGELFDTSSKMLLYFDEEYEEVGKTWDAALARALDGVVPSSHIFPNQVDFDIAMQMTYDVPQRVFRELKPDGMSDNHTSLL